MHQIQNLDGLVCADNVGRGPLVVVVDVAVAVGEDNDRIGDGKPSCLRHQFCLGSNLGSIIRSIFLALFANFRRFSLENQFYNPICSLTYIKQYFGAKNADFLAYFSAKIFLFFFY
jgi:hypothetical protein